MREREREIFLLQWDPPDVAGDPHLTRAAPFHPPKGRQKSRPKQLSESADFVIYAPVLKLHSSVSEWDFKPTGMHGGCGSTEVPAVLSLIMEPVRRTLGISPLWTGRSQSLGCLPVRMWGVAVRNALTHTTWNVLNGVCVCVCVHGAQSQAPLWTATLCGHRKYGDGHRDFQPGFFLKEPQHRSTSASQLTVHSSPLGSWRRKWITCEPEMRDGQSRWHNLWSFEKALGECVRPSSLQTSPRVFIHSTKLEYACSSASVLTVTDKNQNSAKEESGWPKGSRLKLSSL